MIDLDDYKRLDWILTKAQCAMDSLTDWEQDFVNDFTDRLEDRGTNLNVSDKQWDVLERIREKANINERFCSQQGEDDETIPPRSANNQLHKRHMEGL